MELGYVRVSSAGQNTDRQLAELNLPVENLYIDRSSGKDTERPELKNLMKSLRNGDILHVHSLDRLARNLKDLMKILDQLTAKGVEIRFHKENLTFKSDDPNSMNRLILQIFGALAEWERSIIKERQAEGISVARSKGKHMGRPSTVNNEQKEHVKKMFEGDILMPVARVSRESKVPYTTCRRIRDEILRRQNSSAS